MGYYIQMHIYLVYTKDIYQGDTIFKCIYNWYIPRIYQVYTEDILDISLVWYIQCMYFDVGSTLVYTWYIPGIYCLYTNV